MTDNLEVETSFIDVEGTHGGGITTVTSIADFIAGFPGTGDVPTAAATFSLDYGDLTLFVGWTIAAPHGLGLGVESFGGTATLLNPETLGNPTEELNVDEELFLPNTPMTTGDVCPRALVLEVLEHLLQTGKLKPGLPWQRDDDGVMLDAAGLADLVDDRPED